MAVSGKSMHVLKRVLAENRISTKHFNGGNEADRIRILSRLVMLGRENVFIKGRVVDSKTLRKYYLREPIVYSCVECDNSGLHRGKPLILQLDHKDGDRTNNILSNLRWLCPNCHSQTDTYAGRKRYRNGIKVDKRTTNHKRPWARKVDHNRVLILYREYQSMNRVAQIIGISQRAVCKIIRKSESF
jgi:hypothetical protein